MHKVTVAIGADHRGLGLKQALINHNMNFIDKGAFNDKPVDYPDIAAIVCHAYLNGDVNFGVLICNTGIGMSIAANRFRYIRAALCRSISDVELSRKHNNANILILSAKSLDFDTANGYIKLFVNTSFAGGRHELRLGKIDKH